LLLAAGIVLAGFGWLRASTLEQAPAEGARRVRPAPSGGAGVHGSVVVRAPAAGRRGSVRPILMPDFEVALQDAGGKVVATQRTDLFGRYMFSPVPAGKYELVWERQRGWDAGRHPDAVVVTSSTQYPRMAEIRPEKGLTVLSGRVRLADGGSPWYASPFFDVLRFARVAAVGEEPGGAAEPVRANFAGDYALAVSLGGKVRLRAVDDSGKAVGPAVRAVVGRGRSFAPLDVRLNNRRPVLDAVLSRADGETTRHAQPGATVQLEALVRDPDGDTLAYAWKTDSGELGDREGKVDWSLPREPGAYTAYLLVSDGRGGDVQGRVTVAVGAKGDTFSGRVVGTGGRPVAKAQVAVNGATGSTDANGAFNLVVPPARRYVLNVQSAGYAPLSRLFDRPSNGHVWRLVAAQVTQVDDPRQAFELVDRRPELERRRLKGAAVSIPADALVDAAGKPPSGALTATVATLDLGADEAPGDWIARQNGNEVGLISYGVAYVALTDAAGRQFNLAPGKSAQVTIPIPPSMVAKAPAQMPIWTYDVTDGYWKSLGTATLDAATASYKGAVPHFSTINMDQPGPVACLRVHSDTSIPTGLKLRVADVPGQGVEFATVKEVVLDGPLNAVYRIPANSKVKLTVLDAGGTVLPNVILEDGNTTGAIGVPLAGNEVDPGPANPDLWPDPPLSCKPVTLKLNALWAGYPGSPFLTFKDFGANAASAAAYYDVVDPGDLRTNLADWWSVNGFDAAGGAPAGPDYARTSYLNNNDLGSGRDMHFLRHADGTLSAYVTNYSRGGPFDQNPVFADDALADNQPGATVCMEFSPVEGDVTPIVKFFVYAGVGDVRQPAADLDGFGAKFVPNLCLNCHGGSYFNPLPPTLAEVNMGSSFRELDIATYKFTGLRTTANAAEQAAFKQQNQLITATGAARLPIAQLIDGWYAPGGAGLTQDNSFTPANWAGAPQNSLYHDVVKVSCRTCHIAFVSGDDPGGIDWNRYDQLRPRRNDVRDLVIGPAISDTAARVMPHALVTYRNFWIDQVPAHRPAQLWNYSDPNPPGWVAIGAPPP
jgi:hypothetical protein